MSERKTRDESVPGTPAVEPLPEGAEAPPPGVRTMALLRWALVALMAVIAAGAWLRWADAGPRLERSAAQYRCPMHPAVVQGRPGECPICGMDLVAAASTAPASPSSAAAVGGKYWCPMHPEVTSDDPSARCDRCGGMKLVPRPGGAEATGPVPGLSAVEIPAERTQRMGMRTEPVKRQRLGATLRTVGFVSANESSIAVVTARATGWIEDLKVGQSGQRVEKGQVLATLYSPELVTAQQVFLNALRWADKPGVARPAAGGPDPSGKKLEQLGIARVDVEELARTGQVKDALPVRSPVSGYVARKGALPGLYVQPGAELFQIADLSTVWVVAEVFERDAQRVAVGQKVSLLLGATPRETFTGRVQFIYPAVNPETHTLQARMAFRNPDLKLRPGMYGDVIIELGGIEGLAVPTEAVVDTGELQYVFVARDGGRYEPRRVRLGSRDDGRVEITEGLAAGERVVTTANFLVDSESRLRSAVEGFRPAVADDEAAEHTGGTAHEHGPGPARP